MQDLLNNLELSVKAVIDGGALGIETFNGQDGHDTVLPRVTIYAQQGDERPIGSGNYMVTVNVQVRSDAGVDSIEQHRQRCHDVFGLLRIDDIGAVLSGLDNLHVYDPVVNVQASHNREDDAWLSEHRFDCYCCLQDLS